MNRSAVKQVKDNWVNGFRQMVEWRKQVMDKWYSGMTICPILAVGINDVNAGCGQLGESFNHLSTVCAGSGQMGETV